MVMIRSWLFVPGHRQKMIDKSPGRGSDALIYDLEDAVPPARGTRPGRWWAPPWMRRTRGRGGSSRIHGAGHGAMEADLRAVVRPGLEGLVLPKVDRPEDVLSVDRFLTERESEAGVPPGSVRLAAMIESAAGLLQAPAIAAASPRLVALMFGAEDFAVDLGLFSFREGGLMAYARSALVVAAASARLEAVDKVLPRFSGSGRLGARDPGGEGARFFRKDPDPPGPDRNRAPRLPTDGRRGGVGAPVVEAFEAAPRGGDHGRRWTDGGPARRQASPVDSPVCAGGGASQRRNRRWE